MAVNDQLLASASPVREVDRAQSADVRREPYQKHPPTADEVRQSQRPRYSFCAHVINISRRAAARPALMLRAIALIITWLVLLVVTVFGMPDFIPDYVPTPALWVFEIIGCILVIVALGLLVLLGMFADFVKDL
jgi:hypothetical protein